MSCPELNIVFHVCLHQGSVERDFQLSALGIYASVNVKKTKQNPWSFIVLYYVANRKPVDSDYNGFVSFQVIKQC